MKELTKSAILTNLKSRDLTERGNPCYQSGAGRCCQISAESTQWFGQRSRNGRQSDRQTDRQTDGQMVHDDNTLSGKKNKRKTRIDLLFPFKHLLSDAMN